MNTPSEVVAYMEQGTKRVRSDNEIERDDLNRRLVSMKNFIVSQIAELETYEYQWLRDTPEGKEKRLHLAAWEEEVRDLEEVPTLSVDRVIWRSVHWAGEEAKLQRQIELMERYSLESMPAGNGPPDTLVGVRAKLERMRQKSAINHARANNLEAAKAAAPTQLAARKAQRPDTTPVGDAKWDELMKRLATHKKWFRELFEERKQYKPARKESEFPFVF